MSEERADVPEQAQPAGTPWSLLHALRPQLERAARRQGLTAEQAQDVVSEALLRAAGAGELDPARLHAWLHVVAKRLAVDELRKAVGPRLEQRLRAHALPEPDVAEQVTDAAEAVWVASLVGTLPPRQRTVIEHRSRDMAPADIAARLGMSYKTVESLTSRARQSIRAAAADTYNGVFVLFGAVAAAARRTSRAAATVVTASAVALTVGAAAGPPLDGQERPEREVPAAAAHDAGLAAARRPAATGASLVAAAVPSALPRTADKAPAAAQPTARPAGAAVATVPGQRLPVAAHDGIEVRRDGRDGSFAADVLRCLADGVQVTLSHVGCREPEQPQQGPASPVFP
jgi:RNA polymerase sigma factor (sigma-70 family)